MYSFEKLRNVFDRTVQSNSDKTALESASAQYTYSELSEKINVLAHYLRKEHFIEGKRVVVLLPRGSELIISIMAINTCGATFIPLDSQLPLKRIHDIYQDSQADLLISLEQYKSQIPDTINSLLLDTINLSHTEGLDIAISADTPSVPVYIMYTSGTTGKPKGVPISDQNLAGYYSGIKNRYDVNNRDRILQFSSIGFDIFIEELILAFTSGAILVIRDENMTSSTAAFWQFIEQKNISILSLPSAFWHLLCSELGNDALIITDYQLRLVIIGGEAMSVAMHTKWKNTFGNKVRLLNTYGPTEVTIITTIFDATDWDVSKGNIPIGNCLDGIEYYIVNENGEQCQLGEFGELYIGGDNVSEGYINREEINLASFVLDPFNNTNLRFFKTGDIVKEQEGLLYFQGRRDDQVKINGYRVEPSEVEHIISQADSIKSAHVLAEHNILFAYLNFTSNINDEQKALFDLVAQLKSKLPIFMVPEQYFSIAEIPLSSNGKVDKNKLKQQSSPLSLNEYIAPVTATEKQLALIWSKILHLDVESISRLSSFLAVGGNSIYAVKLLSSIRNVFSVALVFSDLFTHQTLQSLAARINASEPIIVDNKTTAFDYVERNNTQEQLPATAQQTSLWLHSQLAQSKAIYNLVFYKYTDADFDPMAAELAINKIILRHDTLRTNFIFDAGNLYPQLNSSSQIKLTSTDLRELPKAAQGEKFNALIKSAQEHVFCLTTDTLVKMEHVIESPQGGILMFTFHHICFDAWSMSIFEQEFELLYRSIINNEDDKLTSLETSYFDFCRWQQFNAQSESMQAKLSYWRKQLEGLPLVHSLPLDKPRPEEKSFNGRNLSYNLGKPLSRALEQLANNNNVSVFMTIYALYALLIARHSNQKDIAIGVPFANRNFIEQEGRSFDEMIGLFAQTTVLRVECNASFSFSQLLEAVKQTHLEAHANSDVSFVQLVKEFKVDRSDSIPPLVQIMLNMDEIELEKGSQSEFLYAESDVAHLDLCLTCRSSANSLIFNFNYNTDIFTADTIYTFHQHLFNLIEAATTQPNMKIYQLPMLTSKEQHNLLVELNPQANSSSADFVPCIKQFEQQVLNQPNELALKDDKQQLTYQELSIQVDKIAHHISSVLSVDGALTESPKEKVIALYAQRSNAIIAVMLGILKAGAAFLCLDPAVPQQRNRFILEDSNSLLLITDKPNDWTDYQSTRLQISSLASDSRTGQIGSNESICNGFTSIRKLDVLNLYLRDNRKT